MPLSPEDVARLLGTAHAQGHLRWSEPPTPQFTRDIIGGIFEYLKERLPQPIQIELYDYDNASHDERYIEVRRPIYVFTLRVHDNIATIESYGFMGNNHNLRAPQQSKQIDLQHPDSLQKIFEHVMSKKFK